MPHNRYHVLRSTPKPSRHEHMWRLSDRVHFSIDLLGYSELKLVKCVVRDGKVTLNGTLANVYLKQLVHSIVMSVHGVRSVTNLIEVEPQSQP